MGNTVYTTRVKTRPARQATPIEQNEVDELDVEQEDVEYDEYGEEIAGPSGGLFSTPGRAMALSGTLLMLVMVLGLVVWLIASQSTNQPPSGPPTVSIVTKSFVPGVDGAAPRNGSPAPDFEWMDPTTGQNVRLSSLKGKPVFINFWGTWCPPCRAEMPEMQRVYNKHRGQIAMIGVSLGPRDHESMVQTFINQYKYTWSFIHDRDSSLGLKYNAFSIPVSYFVDKDGIIKATHIGAMNGADMERYLQQAGAQLGQ